MICLPEIPVTCWLLHPTGRLEVQTVSLRRRIERRLPARSITERTSISAEEGEKYKAGIDHRRALGLDGTKTLVRRLWKRDEPHLARPRRSPHPEETAEHRTQGTCVDGSNSQSKVQIRS